MLECQACLLRCLRAVAGEAGPAANSVSRSGLTHRQSPRAAYASLRSRGYATATERYSPHLHEPRRSGGRDVSNSPFSNDRVDRVDRMDRADVQSISHRVDRVDRVDLQSTSHSRDDIDSHRSDNRHDPNGFRKSYSADKEQKRIQVNKRIRVDLPPDDSADADFSSSMSPQLEKAVKKELVYLKDPLKHADHVRQILRANELDKALAMCRISSREMQVIVSWNHTIDYLLKRRELKFALKIYNEMKKRAQFPDSYTYVILLRGLAEPPVHAETVAKAVSIYHSLAAPNSRVIQSVIHTNAALKVCARGYDMDSLWGVAAKIPEKGPGAADNYTFTTILNAIRENVLLQQGPNAANDGDAIAQSRQTAIEEGRRIWGDVVGKWRKGDLIVDENLICAMGRLLLLGLRPRDWDDVLSLVEQTMNIPRMAAKLGTPARKAEYLSLPRTVAKDATPNEHDEELYGEFDKDLVKAPRRVGGGGSVVYVKPGHNTLSLIMEACLKMVAPKVANDYWNLFVDPASIYDISPDMDNLNSYLRLLRQSRSSTRVVEVLQKDILDREIRPQRKTYRIAMSACARDKNNRHALSNASRILDMMQNNKLDLDVKAVQMYLEMALETQDGKAIALGVERLSPICLNLKTQLQNGGSDRRASISPTHTEETLLLFQTMIGAIDQLIHKNMVPTEDKPGWSKRKAALAVYVTQARTTATGRTAGFDRDGLKERRKENRQERNFRRNTVRREKKKSGEWVEDKAKSAE